LSLSLLLHLVVFKDFTKLLGLAAHFELSVSYSLAKSSLAKIAETVKSDSSEVNSIRLAGHEHYKIHEVED